MMDSSSRAFDFLISNPGQILTTMRQKELAEIEAYLTQCIEGDLKPGSGKGRVCYISGSPGTGKSSSVKIVLQKVHDMFPLKKIRVAAFNANVIRKFAEIRQLIQEQVDKKPITIDDGSCVLRSTELLEEQRKSDSGKTGKRGKKIHKAKKANQKRGKNVEKIQQVGQIETPLTDVCIVYAEQVELVARGNSGQTVQEFINLFQSSSGTNYILLGVSNDTAVAQTMAKKMSHVSARDGPKTIVFNSYTTEDMCSIMKEKIEQAYYYLGLRVSMSDKIIRFTVNRIESNKKGDIRILIEFIKILLLGVMKKSEEKTKDLASNSQFNEEPDQEDEVDSQIVRHRNINSNMKKSSQEVFQVSFQQINKLLASMRCEKSSLIEQLSFNQQIILTLLYAYIKRTDAIQIPYLEIVREIKKAYSDLQIGFSQQTLQGISELESYGMISIKRKSSSTSRKKMGDLESKLVLKVGLAEIQAGVAHNQLLAKYYL